MMSTSTTPRSYATILGDYHRQGFVVVRGLLPQSAVLAARSAYENLLETAPTEIPSHEDPLLVMWYHAKGGFKRYALLRDAPEFGALVAHPAIVELATAICRGPVRLLESVVFNKPPGDGGALAWHQDASFYPLAGGTQVSASIVLDPTTSANGAVSFAIGSHSSPLMCAVDLHSGERRAGDRRAMPEDPAVAGFEIVTPGLDPGDVVLFDALTWHGSGANTTADQPRRLISIRYISLDTVYRRVPGNSATFMQQIATAEGEPLRGPAFPVLF